MVPGKRILCVCKGNTCRSPMLAALLARECGTRVIEVESAGVLKEAAGQPAAPQWAELQQETGIDLSHHRSRWIRDIGDLSKFDLIVCAEPSVVDEVKQLGVPADKVVLANSPDGIPNPWQKGVGAYRDCFPVICNIAQGILNAM